VILAGGEGTRLAPYTLVLPKPLLPIQERPILDTVLQRLREDGCGRATLCVGYLAPLVETYCGTGDRWGIELDYFREEEPLGTVGALSMIDDLPDAPFIVMNGDVLTDLSTGDLLSGHAETGADLTISAFSRTVKDELGIIEEVSDESEFFEKRDVQALVEEVGEWNQMLAGFVGEMKDVLGPNITAPILSYSDFEHLEAKGRDADGSHPD